MSTEVKRILIMLIVLLTFLIGFFPLLEKYHANVVRNVCTIEEMQIIETGHCLCVI